VTKDKLIFFEKILLHYGITKNVIKKNIYLIDYCVSGESVASAGKILNKIFLQFKRYGLIYWTNSSLDIDNAHIFDKKIFFDKLIDVKHLNNLINFEYDFGFRTIPKFSFFKSYDDTFFEFKKYNSIDEIKNQLSI